MGPARPGDNQRQTHSRMAERTYRMDRQARRRKGTHSKWRDSVTHIWKAIIKQVNTGEAIGICAEVEMGRIAFLNRNQD